MADGSQGAQDFDRFTPRWTADMDMRLIAAHGRGETLAQIGAHLGVSRNAVAGRMMRLRKAGRIRLPPAGRIRLPPAGRIRLPPAAPDRSEPGPAAPRRSLAAADRLGQAPSARLWVQHLDAIGNPPGFAPAVDLALVEGLARGRSLAVVAGDLGLDLQAALARFFALLPVTGIDAQLRLIEALRARVLTAGDA